ncbi:MAG: rhodanese-like domain-containing protein [Pseudomonadota bacterium]
MVTLDTFCSDSFVQRLKLFVLVALFLPAYVPAQDNEALQAVHQELSGKFDEVAHVSSDQLQRLSSDQILLLDVREADEYAVSHLVNAIQVDPGIGTRQFMRRFASRLQDKIVIFYCSVGYRSSGLAEDLQQRLVKSGAKAVYNLEEGIFGWHNAGMKVVNTAGQTSRIHPYNNYWGRLLNRQEEVSYRPSE